MIGGSSPRMRGAPAYGTAHGAHLGIIPADAGSTNMVTEGCDLDEDHPRGCGEHSGEFLLIFTLLGSSPRMRGARVQQRTGVNPERIIPADAGSTTILPRYMQPCKDHPRGCGEHSVHSYRSATPPGSSPRMRGARCVGMHHSLAARIIPADAGSTPVGRVSAVESGDHPRGCGEHCGLYVMATSTIGSSPRMRGAH